MNYLQSNGRLYKWQKLKNQKKLLKILNAMFQLDQSDLDFGIYRIMNAKSKEINDWRLNESK